MAIESLKNRLEKDREKWINMTEVVEISWRLAAIAMQAAAAVSTKTHEDINWIFSVDRAIDMCNVTREIVRESRNTFYNDA